MFCFAVPGRFIWATCKIGGSGLLSGSGGTMGNDMIGLDNAVTLGVNYCNSEGGVDGGKNVVGVLRYEDWGVTGEERGYTSAFIPGIGAFLKANAKLGAECVIAEDADYNTLKVFALLAF